MQAPEWVASLQERVRTAAAARTPLMLLGSGSKHFYGDPRTGEPVELAHYAGITDYAPGELVLSARCGTPLTEIEQMLAGRDQMLAFEPPYFGPGATLGGCVAAGLCGPGRPYGASIRDHMLGVRCITGDGSWQSFGGTVLKNVAGFDVARMMVGAFGRLGILTDITVRTAPRPEHTRTLVYEGRAEDLVDRLVHLSHEQGVTAAAAHGRSVYLRFSGSEGFVATRSREMGGDLVPESFWADLREQRPAFFQGQGTPLWRLSVAPAAVLNVEGTSFLEWGGAQRWFRSAQDAHEIRAEAARVGGHATVFRGGAPDVPVFHAVAPALAAVQERLRRAFDPYGILNPS